eukprot:TRINITY_DN25641_c1_g1_i1.p1 TRINITY_DN25641_c1_g1~~TRINITY_DN25641_c1_g1_i1.p1  ORF type:complete len:121 (-),score=18.18 TRINITY_DN25641_c1_g1_i1:52-414(-)
MPPKKDAKGKDAKGKTQKQQAKTQKKGSSSAKQKKKKWSKGKTREKLDNMVLFDKAAYDKLYKEVPASKVITTATVSDKLRANGSLARKAIKELLNKGLIRPVLTHRRTSIYTRASAKKE